jgi:hypothetical protein
MIAVHQNVLLCYSRRGSLPEQGESARLWENHFVLSTSSILAREVEKNYVVKHSRVARGVNGGYGWGGGRAVSGVWYDGGMRWRVSSCLVLAVALLVMRGMVLGVR